jgi:hypothetical protein
MNVGSGNNVITITTGKLVGWQKWEALSVFIPIMYGDSFYGFFMVAQAGTSTLSKMCRSLVLVNGDVPSAVQGPGVLTEMTGIVPLL